VGIHEKWVVASYRWTACEAHFIYQRVFYLLLFSLLIVSSFLFFLHIKKYLNLSAKWRNNNIPFVVIHCRKFQTEY
jgi:hypothetical protein